MSTNAVAAQGTKLFVGTSTDPTNYTQISDVVTFSGPSQTNPEYEVTDLSSTAKEYKVALPDPGELTFTLLYQGTDTEHIYIRDSGTNVRNWKMHFADSTQFQILGSVSGFNRTASVDGPLTADVSIKLSGAATEATATS
jgi:hypothetical protein